MSSNNFNAPPLKMTILAIGVVVALHVLTAMALVAIKPSTPPIDPPKVTPPIEIQMVTLPVENEELEVAIDKPQKEIQPKPATVAKAEPKPQVVKKPQPVTKPKPAVKTPAQSEPKKTTPQFNKQPEPSKVVKKEPFRHEVERQQPVSTIQADTLAAENERKLLAVQAEKDRQQAHAKAMREAQDAADAKADREAEAAARVAKEAEAAARNKADAEAKAAAAASNTPVNFNASNANWAAKPNFSFPDSAKRSARSGDTFQVVLVLQVNKQGGIDSVSLAQSSGNAVLDREAQRQVRSGKFKPFMKNNVPVVGNVTLPISYGVP